MADKNYVYYVEGQCEEKLLKILKTDMRLIQPGKVIKRNVIQDKLRPAQLKTLKKGTTAVLVFDTDTDNTDILFENIELLKRETAISKVICITQVENLEDVNTAKELTNSKSTSSFKSDFIRASNLKGTLENHDFCFQNFWSKSTTKKQYHGILNEADQIRLKK